jgi:hypothetical protein
MLVHEILPVEVGEPDGANQSLVHQLLHDGPRLYVVGPQVRRVESLIVQWEESILHHRFLHLSIVV